jgi:hypothetical protein
MAGYGLYVLAQAPLTAAPRVVRRVSPGLLENAGTGRQVFPLEISTLKIIRLQYITGCQKKEEILGLIAIYKWNYYNTTN